MKMYTSASNIKTRTGSWWMEGNYVRELFIALFWQRTWYK